LSYKDSLGVAFITQSQSYDPWSNVNSGSEYQLAGIQGDRYLVSGKENDNITGNTLLDWRDYDSVTGRMNSFDPDATEGGQMSLSPFAYSWNRPSMLNDPDGRCPMCIGFMVGLFTSAIGNAISGTMPKNIGQFLLPGVQGAIGGGIASAIGGAFAGMGSFAGKGLLQAGTHAFSGGLQSAAFGGNFWQGAASSGISSGFASGADGLGLGGVGQLLGGGLAGGVTSSLFGGDFWDGARNGLITSGLNHLSHGGGDDDAGETRLLELLGAKSREPYTGFWGNVEYYWTGGKENGLQYGKDGSIIGFSPMGGDAPGVSPAGKILKYGKFLSKSDFKGLKSHYRQIIEHTTKLRHYIKDPYKFDNLGILAKNASNPTVVRRIISTRINHLQHEIKTFNNNINKILTRNGF
jgi:RHS repeat-associated protein